MSLQAAYRMTALVSLFSLLAAEVTTAQPTAEPPLRISLELAEHKVPRGPDASILKWVERGIVRELPKRSVTRVEAPDTADLKIVVSYRISEYPEERTEQADGKVKTTPAFVLERLTADVGGQRLEARGTNVGLTAETLGRDIALVLSTRLQGGAGASRATDVEAFIRKLDGRNPVERARAAAQLGRLGPAGVEATDALIRRLSDDAKLRVVGPGTDTTVGDEVAKALLSIGATTALMNFVRSKEDGTGRARALRELAKGKVPELPDVIRAALDDPSSEVRTEATWVAARVLGKSAIPKLIEILARDRSRAAVAAARANLEHLTGQDFGLNADKWRAWLASQRQ